MCWQLMRHTGYLIALLSWAGLAHAEPVVFYRCTDAQDNLTVQNQPCPKGMRQQKKIMQGVSSAPLPPEPATKRPPPAASAVAPPVVATASPTTTAEPAPVAAPRPPPPALYSCTTREQQRYTGEVAEPPPRCIPLPTQGLDGSPDRAGGSACEVVHDQCQALPSDGLCAAWQAYVAEAETHWRFAIPEHTEALREEFQRRQQLLQASDCATSP
ncbi:hypothetical protein XALC_2867 [Xanthomonas albilineans GPE PC73]|uniref:DUF4124 domain-containing protein n=2 Tax=Xanthomonas albilineans TaxID=29447 RepID=D2UG33_XANAP|nr:hypothetical protein XALC_2867 [Xanthomonas albilineans GPE PC73]